MSKGELTRQRIIALAAPIFNRQGFAGTSMQDVMEATGLEKGGLYRHFSSKEELAVETFRYTLESLIKLRTEKLDGSDGAVAHLRALICRFIETPSAVPGGCPLMNTAVDSDDGNPVLRGLACDGFQAWKGRLSRIVEDGLASGEIQDGTDPRQVANTIVSILEGALMISRLEGTKQALWDAQTTLWIVLDRMSAEPPGAVKLFV